MLRMKLIGALILLTVAPNFSRAQLADSSHEEIIEQVRDALDSYRDAMLSRDYDAMVAFWSHTEDFLMAGDGHIIGGIDEWITTTTGHYDATSEWRVWDWEKVHILPLAENAAVATVEFRFRWIDKEAGEQNSRGSWTYVFRRENIGWKVVHSNGKHVPL